MLNLPSLEQAQVHAKPFPFVVVPNFVNDHQLDEIERDYPVITKPGSFPLESVRGGPGFSDFMHELRQPVFRKIMGSKLVTVLVYMNGKWETDGGRLRLLNSPNNLDDVVMEVPPDRGTLLAFLNGHNAWHGHKPFQGERRVVQLNWVRNNWVVWREGTRHRVSALAKKLKP